MKSPFRRKKQPYYYEDATRNDWPLTIERPMATEWDNQDKWPEEITDWRSK